MALPAPAVRERSAYLGYEVADGVWKDMTARYLLERSDMIAVDN